MESSRFQAEMQAVSILRINLVVIFFADTIFYLLLLFQTF
jgi:hypothetical protein